MINDKEKQQFERLVEELRRQLASGRKAAELVLLQLEEITEVCRDAPVHVVPAGEATRNRAQWFERWYAKLGFFLTVPVPPISDEEYHRHRVERQQHLFYRPPSGRVSYEAFMRVVGQKEHWTVTSNFQHAQIGWKPTATGYWFWAEACSHCPRVGQSWNDLVEFHRLLSLEEYVIMWWAHDENAVSFDKNTSCWLRTRFSEIGAMHAFGGAEVHAGGSNETLLATIVALRGGRIMQEVPETCPSPISFGDHSTDDMLSGDDYFEGSAQLDDND